MGFIYKNNKLWEDWQKEAGPESVPKDGVVFKMLNFGTHLHPHYVGSRNIGSIPIKSSGMHCPLFYSHILKNKEVCQIRWSPTVVPADKDGSPKWSDVQIMFTEGQFVCKNDKALLWFLNNHILNRDCAAPARKKMFYKLDEAKEQHDRRTKNKLEATVLYALANDWSDDEVKSMYEAHFKRGTQNADLARNELKAPVMADPAGFMALYKSDVRTTKNTLRKAQANGIIAFDENKRFWYWVKPDQDTIDPNDIITKVAKSLDPIEDFLKFVQNHDDGNTIFTMVEEALDKASKAV